MRHNRSHFLLLMLVALLLGSVPGAAQAKRYILKRDPQTGRTRLIDPNQGIISKVTKPIIRPVVRPLVKTKNLIFGKPKRTPRGQIPGFGGRIDQRTMQKKPEGVLPAVERTTTRMVDAAGTVAGGNHLGKRAARFFRKSFRKVFNTGSGASSSAPSRGVQARR